MSMPWPFEEGCRVAVAGTRDGLVWRQADRVGRQPTPLHRVPARSSLTVPIRPGPAVTTAGLAPVVVAARPITSERYESGVDPKLSRYTQSVDGVLPLRPHLLRPVVRGHGAEQMGTDLGTRRHMAAR